MLNITQQIVNVRQSNRVDNIVSDDLAGCLGLSLLQSPTRARRCYPHSMCSVLGPVVGTLHTAATKLLARLSGDKRLALEPEPAPVIRMSWHWHMKTTMTGTGRRSAATGLSIGTSQLLAA